MNVTASSVTSLLMPAPAVSAATTVTVAVIAMLALAIFLFVLLIVLRFVVSRRERKTEKVKDEIRPLVYELLTSERTEEDIIVSLSSLIPRRDRDKLEQVLLENARTLKGRELRILSDAFVELGFAGEDMRNLSSRDPMKRAESAFHLGTMRVEEATPELVESLSDRSPEVTFACLNALSKIGTDRATRAVVEYLQRTPGIETLRVAEVILERKQGFTPYLHEWLERGVEDRQRLVLIIKLVGAMRDIGSVGVLMEYLDSPDPLVRKSTAEALGDIGASQACGPLLGALEDPDPSVRESAADSLGGIECVNAIERLESGVFDEDIKVRLNCAIALSRLGEEGQVALERTLTAEDELGREIVTEVLDRKRLDGQGEEA